MHTNLLLQWEDPNIFLVADTIRSFLKKVFSKFTTIEAISNADDITEVDYLSPSNKLDYIKISIGMLTRQNLCTLLEHGDINENDKKRFFRGIRAFYVDAVSQALQKLPFNDDVLNHAQYLNFDKGVTVHLIQLNISFPDTPI